MITLTKEADLANAAMVAAGWKQTHAAGTTQEVGFDPAADWKALTTSVSPNTVLLSNLSGLSDLDEEAKFAVRGFIFECPELTGILSEYLVWDDEGRFSPKDGYATPDGSATIMADTEACLGRSLSVKHETCRRGCSLGVTHFPDGQAAGPTMDKGYIAISESDMRPRTNACQTLCVFYNLLNIPQAPTSALAEAMITHIGATLKYVADRFRTWQANRGSTDSAPAETGTTEPEKTPVVDEPETDPEELKLVAAGWIKHPDGMWEQPVNHPGVSYNKHGALQLLEDGDWDNPDDTKKEDPVGWKVPQEFEDMFAYLRKKGVKDSGITRMVNGAEKQHEKNKLTIEQDLYKRVAGMVKRNNYKGKKVKELMEALEQYKKVPGKKAASKPADPPADPPASTSDAVDKDEIKKIQESLPVEDPVSEPAPEAPADEPEVQDVKLNVEMGTYFESVSMPAIRKQVEELSGLPDMDKRIAVALIEYQTALVKAKAQG